MCGIIAYISTTPCLLSRIIQIILRGLKQMEYRGYDSSGLCFNFTVDGKKQLNLTRSVGFISDLDLKINNWLNNEKSDNLVENDCIALGHTRWATHGVPSEKNCHPMLSNSRGDFRVVHNGIVTNYIDLKTNLEGLGYQFTSETDTEVIAVLLKDIYDMNYPQKPAFTDLCLQLVHKIQGSYALAITSEHYPGECIGIRHKSPLIVGIKCKENIVGRKISISSTEYSIFPQAEFLFTSDVCGIVGETRNIIYLANGDMVHVDCKVEGLKIQNFGKLSEDVREISHCPFDLQNMQKGEFRYFMEKEIYEQAERVGDTLQGRVDWRTHSVILPNLDCLKEELCHCRRVIMLACGTSYYSAMSVKSLMEQMTDLTVIVETASAFMDLPITVDHKWDIFVFISQSGETADLLSALTLCREKCKEGSKTLFLCLTNNIGSTLARECLVLLDIRAGLELGVASTKVYSCQSVLLILLALKLSEIRNGNSHCFERRRQILGGLSRLPEHIDQVISTHSEILRAAETNKSATNMMLVGRGYSFPACSEASLKIKELAYIHSTAISAGELKHGPMALVDQNASVIMFLFNDSIYQKSCNALQQIIARKGRPIVLSCGRVESSLVPSCSHLINIPHTVDCLQFIPAVVAMQIFAMESAHIRSYNVDKPRNLAKSVTVE